MRPMILDDMYKAAIELGMDKDTRKKRDFTSIFKKAKKDLKAKNTLTDEDTTWNPYDDCRIHHGKGRDVKKILVGIDIQPSEVILAHLMKESGVDGVVGHHPLGRASLGLYKVMDVQKQWMENFGVPSNMVDDLMNPRMAEVQRAVLPSNHMRSVDAARVLDIPLMNIHSASDMIAQHFVQQIIDSARPKTVKNILDAMMGIPEYNEARKYGLGFNVLAGCESDRCGKVVVKMAGGTSFGKQVYKELSASKVGTVVCMHAPENHLEEAKKHHIRIINAGHMSSDSIGMNHVCDIWESEGVDIIPVSGFIRHSRLEARSPAKKKNRRGRPRKK